MKWSTIKIIIYVVASAGALFVLLYFLRDRFPAFARTMDTYAPINPFNMANIVLKTEQEKFVRQLHPTVQDKFRKFISDVEDSGWSVICTSAWRSSERQAQLHKQNAKNARPCYSLHEFGFALDINAVKGAKALRLATSTSEWENSGIIAIAKNHGLKWGGYFVSYKDRVHFYVDKNINTLRALATAQQGSDASKWRGNEIQLV